MESMTFSSHTLSHRPSQAVQNMLETDTDSKSSVILLTYIDTQNSCCSPLTFNLLFQALKSLTPVSDSTSYDQRDSMTKLETNYYDLKLSPALFCSCCSILSFCPDDLLEWKLKQGVELVPRSG